MVYLPSKTAVKGFWIFVYAVVGALISFVAQLPPDQSPFVIMGITAGLKMLENYIKHRKG